jgi:GTPase
VLNKIDLIAEDERAAQCAAFAKSLRHKGPLFTISAIDGTGCRELTFAIQAWLDAHPQAVPEAAAAPAEAVGPVVLTPAPVAARRRRRTDEEA